MELLQHSILQTLAASPKAEMMDDDSSGTTGPACLTSDNKFLSGGAGFPEHLWTTYDADFGNTWSQPFVGRVRLEISEGETSTFVDRYVYFVGGGLDPIDTNPRDGVSKGNGFLCT